MHYVRELRQRLVISIALGPRLAHGERHLHQAALPSEIFVVPRLPPQQIVTVASRT